MKVAAFGFAVLLGVICAFLVGQGLNFGHRFQPIYLLMALPIAGAVLWLTFAARTVSRPTGTVIGLGLIAACFGALVVGKTIVLKVQEHNAAAAARPSLNLIDPYPRSSVRGYRIAHVHNDNFPDDFWDVNEWYTLTRTDVIQPAATLKHVAAHYTRELGDTGCEFGPVRKSSITGNPIALGGFSCPIGSSLNASVNVHRQGDRMTVLVSSR